MNQDNNGFNNQNNMDINNNPNMTPNNNIQPQSVQEPVQPQPTVEPIQSIPEPIVDQPAQSTPVSTFEPVQNTQQPHKVSELSDAVFSNIPEANTTPVQNSMPKQKKSAKKPLIILGIIAVLAVVGYFVYSFVLGSNYDYDRTVMIYMVGADLESENKLATNDLNGLDYNKLKDNNTKVIVIAGGSKKWANDYINVENTSIYELTESGYKVVKKQELTNMGLPDTLTNFIDYGYNNYKSKNYDLVLWNHGGAIFGAEFDELHEDDILGKDPLSPSELKTALSKSKASKKKFELVLFRTCLNGTIEIADTFKDYSNYLISSEESTSGYLPSESVLKIFNDVTSKDNGKDIGIKYTDNYMDYIDIYVKRYNLPKSSEYPTYAVIDLSKMNDLEKSVNDLFSSIDVSKDYNTISKVRKNLLQYGLPTKIYDMVDLYNLVDGIKSISPDKAKNVLDNLSNTVVYCKAPDTKSKGLSIYFPFNAPKDWKEYMVSTYNFSSLSGYKTFMDNFYAKQSGGTKSFSFNDNVTTITQTEQGSDFELVLTDEQKENFASANYIVFKDNGDGTYRPIYNGEVNNIDGNSIKVSLRNKLIRAYDSTNPESGTLINVIVKSEDDNYIVYETRPRLENLPTLNENLDALDQIDEFVNNWKWYHCKMNLIYDKNNNTITVGEVAIKPENVYNSDTKENFENYNVLVNLKDYTHVAFGGVSYTITDENDNYTDEWVNNQEWNGYEIPVNNIAFSYDDFSSDSDYYAVFQIWDIYNNSYVSKLVKMN